jgi:hypothetical protein
MKRTECLLRPLNTKTSSMACLSRSKTKYIQKTLIDVLDHGGVTCGSGYTLVNAVRTCYRHKDRGTKTQCYRKGGIVSHLGLLKDLVECLITVMEEVLVYIRVRKCSSARALARGSSPEYPSTNSYSTRCATHQRYPIRIILTRCGPWFSQSPGRCAWVRYERSTCFAGRAIWDKMNQ